MECFLKWRKLEGALEGDCFISFQHEGIQLIALHMLYTPIVSLSSMIIMLMLPPLVASYVLSLYS